ncbi:chromosome segregation protein SMC [soil metagenome]
MFVKSLTLRGFKSFASATTLRLEPGITCIVGPNGSGKSNVVDALAWVMGEQGAKSLRGGKMEDVVFAGTHGRPPLGRAEVSMTIDNSDGALPIDYAEVTLTRTMFRNGGSDYSINGTSCRLLDVQELLSDSGIGREMHVIVGQGQLDQVLRATPEERRGFIEEAAGVLKHRKRKERALRKLDTMEANLTRLADVTTEIRRQLGPLGRQAQTARRAVGIQSEVRDARLRILADDLSAATGTLEHDVATEAALMQRRTQCEQALSEVNAEVAAAERASAEAAPIVATAQETYYTAAALIERVRATHQVATERVRLMQQETTDASVAAASDGRDPEHLKATAETLRGELQVLQDREAHAASALADAEGEREAAEQAQSAQEARSAALAQAAADRREGLATLAGQVAARRSRLEGAQAELGRLRETETQAGQRHEAAQQEYAGLEVSIADVQHGERDLDQTYEVLSGERQHVAERLQQREDSAAAEQSRAAALQARCEALEMSTARKDGTAALLAATDRHSIAGAVSSLITIRDGHEVQIAAALAWVGEALVMESGEAAADAVRWLRDQEQGRAGLLVLDASAGVPAEVESDTEPIRAGDDRQPSGRVSQAALPDHVTWAAEVVDADSAALRRAVRAWLADVVLVDTGEQAQALLGDAEVDPARTLVVVTSGGDLFNRGWVRGGSSDAASAIEVESALEAARDDLQQARSAAERAGFDVARIQEELALATDTQQRALSELHDSDAQMAAVAERLSQLGADMRSSAAEAERARRAITAAETAAEQSAQELQGLQARLNEAQATTTVGTEHEPTDTEEAVALPEGLADAAARARSAETEARLTLRSLQERTGALQDRAQALADAAAEAITARERAAARSQVRSRQAATASAVAQGSDYLARWTEQVGRDADHERLALAAAQQQREHALGAARARSRDLSDQVRELTSSVHRDEVARAEQRLRIEALRTRALDELGIDPDIMAAEFGPDQPVPVPDSDAGTEVEDEGGAEAATSPGVPFVRADQEKRLRAAERKLAALGRVNPLALEEFAALEERHAYLNEQVEDLRRSKVDLLGIVDEVDQRVQRVFNEAFEDTAAQFEIVFERLFPGGEGRLVLTHPDDMLTTGIEVEARPPGKRIKRLSLLSGGERSLTAVALLISIFKARPSPFYIMDEVEASLDDTNLGRLITLFEELRDSSQLIVITHQKRTMEVADALYGVSMQGDGVTTVISQRLTDKQPQSA